MIQQDANRRIITYLVIVFALSTVFYVLISRGGGLDNGNDGYVIGLMWSPAVAGLITTFIFQRNLRGMGWGLGRPMFYVIAFLLPILYAGIVYGVVWLFGLGGLDTSALGDNPVSGLLSALTVGVLGAALLALGEEIGWRGLLVPQLARQHAFLRTAVISGVIWGIWHVPLIIGGGYNSGAPTWYAVACFMVHITGMSFAFAWLRLRSGSLWPAVLLHATHNTFIQSVMDPMTIDTGNTAYFTTEFGLGLAIMGIVVATIFWRIGIPEQVDPLPVEATPAD